MGWIRGNAIGHGSSATVYLATSTCSGDVFAVKSAEVSRSEFLQAEQRILSSVCHPSLVGYRGFGVSRENGKVMYNLFMEHMAGGTVGDEIARRGGRMKESAAGFYTRQVLRGLEYLHGRGLVHCDIKARNILVGEDGAKIADFGCSKWVHRVADEPAAISGTPMFMGPEVARGEEQGFPSDIWALGCTLIEMVTGGSPWPDTANPVSVLYRIGYSGDLPEVPSFLSHEAKDFLEKCLKRNPTERWTASQLLQHPFLRELNSGSEQIKESHSHSNSPTSILDPGLWNSLEEEESETLSKPVHESWDDRIRRLSMFREEITWESEDEDWITVRGYDREEEESYRSAVDGEAEVDSISGSTSEASFTRYDLEEQESRGCEIMQSLELLDKTVSNRLRKSNIVVNDLTSKRDRSNLLVHLISKF